MHFALMPKIADEEKEPVVVQIMDKGLAEVFKLNPYHDDEGKFTTAPNATFVRIGPQFESVHRRTRGALAAAKIVAPIINQHATEVEPGITKAMQSVAGRGKLVGLEFAVKSTASLTRKILSDALTDKISASKAAGKIGDSVRYTLQLGEDDYATGAIEALQALESKGYKVYKFKNTWRPGAVYQGLNTNLEAPDGTKVELQFHTAKSFETKEVKNHKLYEKSREPGVRKDIKRKLEAQMAANWDDVPVPKGVYDMKWPPNKG